MRLQTLVIVRWFAIFGQLVAVLVASRVFTLVIPIGPISMTIGLSFLINLFLVFLYPANKRLTGNGATLILLFDLVQLGFLLFLTGGLNNPFALLILAPVIIAANVLNLRSVVLIGTVAILLISALSLYFIPLTDISGEILALPRLFRFGFLAALSIGVVFLGVYARLVTTELNTMNDALVATRLALAREQKLTDLGGVIAAAAHELGTPLATIKLASSELMEELETDKELQEDARLINEQAERCREILHSMGRAGKEDKHLQFAPLSAVLAEAAEPHLDRGKTIAFVLPSDNDQPTILRQPEIIHGLRNLIQNAVDFAATHVEVQASWTDESVTVRITDDGKGYPAHIIGRIGDPLLRNRRRAQEVRIRPGYSGMGLGLFIAKTLLERTGAVLDFSNGAASQGLGAIVRVKWSRSDIEPAQDPLRTALGENEILQA